MIDANQPAEVQIRKLRKINQALMARVERATDISGSAFALFQTAISLEGEVRARAHDLRGALHRLPAPERASIIQNPGVTPTQRLRIPDIPGCNTASVSWAARPTPWPRGSRVHP